MIEPQYKIEKLGNFLSQSSKIDNILIKEKYLSKYNGIICSFNISDDDKNTVLNVSVGANCEKQNSECPICFVNITSNFDAMISGEGMTGGLKIQATRSNECSLLPHALFFAAKSLAIIQE